MTEAQRDQAQGRNPKEKVSFEVEGHTSVSAAARRDVSFT